jgi:hypothetical protein
VVEEAPLTIRVIDKVDVVHKEVLVEDVDCVVGVITEALVLEHPQNAPLNPTPLDCNKPSLMLAATKEHLTIIGVHGALSINMKIWQVNLSIQVSTQKNATKMRNIPA